MAPKKKAKTPAAKPVNTNQPTPAGTPAAQERKRVTERDMWLTGAPPWESYGQESGTPGLEGMVEDGATEVLVGTIEDQGKGKIKFTRERMPGETAVREDSFNTGSADGSRVVFSADAFYSVLLTDDMKYRAMQNSYKFYREDPVYRGLVNGIVNFVIGKGLKFKALDEDPAVNDYCKKFWDLNRMSGKDSEIVRRFFLTGEIALRLYPKGPKNVDAKFQAIRLVPFWRIAEVRKDEEDAETITGFRVWKASGPYKPHMADEDLTPQEMLYWKNSTPEEDRGEPPLLACMRPCKWYQDWINNRVILNRYRTAIVLFKKIITGTPGRTAGVASASPDATTNHMGLGGKLEKRLPKSGTVITHNDKVEYDWKSPQLQASDAGEDGRKILLYIAAAAQVPEFLLGDASNANFASTFVAENPFIRQIEAYQTFFEGVFGELMKLVIEHGIATGQLKANSTETKLEEGGFAVRAGARFLRKIGLHEAAAGLEKKAQTEVKTTVPTRTDIAIEWPSLLHKNQLEDAQTMQIHQNMGLASRETLAGKAGYDWEVEQDRIIDDKNAGLDEFTAQRQAELDMAEDPDNPDGGKTPGKDKTKKGPSVQGQGKA